LLSKSEINENLEKYQNLILKWNKVHNLVSKSSEEHIKERHIDDSVRIFKYFDEEPKIICDFGSGAGLPAIPLAIYLKDIGSTSQINLYESRNKKTKFLEICKDELGLSNINIINDRIENSAPIKADFITARAFASLIDIFSYSKNFITENTKFILHKGEKIHQEIEKAENKFHFKHKFLEKNDVGGVILLAESLKAK